MTAPLVDCEGLVHIYKTAELEVVALQGLDLVVERGETVAIAGRSGSGKTTLMNILAGVDAPTAGSAVVAGHDLGRMSPGERERYRRRVAGYVIQHSQANLSPELTAEENVQVPMLAETGGDRPGRARELLDRLGLQGLAAKRPAELSGGENQRLALAVALANGPSLLLADEPTSELDGATARELLTNLGAFLREQGTAAVMVTHDPELARHVDRVIQIRDGRTSTETRYVEHAQHGLVADELVIMDRAGRIQVPRAYLDKLGLRGRVRVHLEEDHIRILPATNEEKPDA